jgi:hypothetical protein
MVFVIGGLLAISQGATAAPVFNPSLTMYGTRHSTTPPLVKASNVKVRETRQQADYRGATKIEVEDAAFPMISMNK